MANMINVCGDNYRWQAIPQQDEVLFRAESAEQPPWRMVVHLNPNTHSKFDSAKTLKEINQHLVTPIMASDWITQAIKQGWRSKPGSFEFDSTGNGELSVRKDPEAHH